MKNNKEKENIEDWLCIPITDTDRYLDRINQLDMTYFRINQFCTALDDNSLLVFWRANQILFFDDEGNFYGSSQGIVGGYHNINTNLLKQPDKASLLTLVNYTKKNEMDFINLGIEHITT